MVKSCAVVGCFNRSNRDKMSYFCIPTVIKNQGEKTQKLSEKRRHLWITELGRDSFTPSQHTRICAEHFITGKPSTLYDTTNPDWVPTLKMDYSSSSSEKDRNDENKQGTDKKKTLDAAESLLSLSSHSEDLEDSETHTADDFSAVVKVTVSTQTEPLDPGPEMIKNLQDELQRLTAENMELREKLLFMYRDICK